MTSLFAAGKIKTSDEFLHEIDGFLRVHKDGRIERLLGTATVPAGVDPSTGVRSKDVLISPENNISARLYIPKTAAVGHKLPVLIFIHGGGFLIGSSSSPVCHPTLNLITAESDVVVVSVDYRLAPEHLIPVAYDDSWEVIKWVAAHDKENGPDPWLNNHANLQKVFLSGDSAGANIAHNMAIRVGSSPYPYVAIKVEGLILLHPYFGGKDPIGSECGKHSQLKAFTDQFWVLANRSESGLDDPLFNPAKDPNLSGLGCSKVLVCVAEHDHFRDRGVYYKELMEKSGWGGKIEFMETKGEDHVFFLYKLSSDKACTLRKRVCAFINHINGQA